MRSCCLCKKKLRPDNGTFFGIPKDERRRKIWSEICRMQFAAYSRMCEDHFLSSDIVKGSKKSFLLPNAVPTFQCKQLPNENSHDLFCVMGCPSGSTLYKFPNREKNRERRKLWLDFLNIEEPNIDIFACDRHFSNKQINEKGIRIDAVPDIPKYANVSAPQNIVFKNQNLNSNNDVMLQEEPIMKIPVVSSIYCTKSTQTNMRLCGLVQVSDFADEFRFNCFYCSKVFPLEKWKNFVNHIKKRHFEMEEAFKISEYISEDHDYTPIGLPQSTPTELALRKVVINAESLLPFLVDPLEHSHSSFEAFGFSPVRYYTPNENKEVSNNVHFIEANSSSIAMPLSGVTNQLLSSQKEPEISSLPLSFKGVNKSTKMMNFKKNKLKSKSKLMPSGVLYLEDLKQQTSKTSNFNRCLKRKTSEATVLENGEVCKPFSTETVKQKPTEITFEYTPSAIVDSLLDSMKNYPVLWQFDDEPFNEDFYEAVEDLCKIINDKWSLNIDNLKMRRSINRILRFYCYLYPNENVENIHQFTNYYDKCASFLPSSVDNVTYARCSHCYVCYKHDFNLKPHLLEEQKYLQWPYKCVQCKECFRENDEYEFHKRLPHYDEIFRCEPCNKTFVRRNIYNKHINLYHPKDDNERRKYKCNVCGKAYKTSTSLCAHKIIHGERKYKCHLCPKSYFVNAKLMIHLKSHRKEYDLMCEVCGKGFILHSNLREHMKKHTGAKVTCNICNLKLRKSSLSRHLRLVHAANGGNDEKVKKLRRYYRSLIKSSSTRKRKETERRKYHCKICKISFEKYKLIVEHNKEFHFDTPKWPCKMCSTEFRQKLNLKRHYRKKHDLHAFQVFKLVDENEDLNVVLAMDAEQVDEIAERQVRLQNENTRITKPLGIKEELMPGEIYFEEEKIQSSVIHAEIMNAAADIETQDIKTNYMNAFFTDLLIENEEHV